jgi:pimeloyl-ACP methyl ester carboxylesterase
LTYVVPLKASGSKKPFFCVHGVGGNVLNYNLFVPYLDVDQPMYGLQCSGLDGVTKPFDSIQQMANAYNRELRQIQPHGPYKIGGGSMGGLVAFEMAQQLIKAGVKVGLLLMFDSATPEYVARKQCTNKNCRKNRRSFTAQVYHSTDCRIKDFMKYSKCTSYRIRGVPIPHKLRYWFIEQKNLSLIRHYKPESYSYPIILFRGVLENPDPDRGWDCVAHGGIKYYDLDCGHENMIEYSGTAQLLNEILVEHSTL